MATLPHQRPVLPMSDVPDMASAARDAAGACEEPVVIISDVHLRWGGDWRGRCEGLRPIWRGAKTVVFNGDTVDWQLARRPRRLAKVMAFLPEVCRSDGVRAVFLAGNADLPVAKARHLVLGAGQVLVTHGDAIFPGVSLWVPHPVHIRRFREKALAGMSEAQRQTLEGQLLVASRIVDAMHSTWPHTRRGRWERRWRRLLMALRRPLGVLAILVAWRRAPSMAMEFMRRYAPQQRILVMGHTHRPGVWMKHGQIVINTGSFAKLGRPWMVRIEDGRVLVLRVKVDGQRCSPGAVVGEFALRD